MNCERAKSELPLLLYGELSFDDEERLQTHLDSCETCREELKKEKAVFRLMDAGGEELPASLLSECRQELVQRIAASPVAPPTLWERVTNFFEGMRLAPARILRPAGAIALVAVGFVSGRFASNPAQSAGGYVESRVPMLVSGSATPAVAARVRQVDTGADGQLQIIIDETRQRIVTGHANDAAIRRLLLAAATDSADPGVRVETVEILRNSGPSDETRKALVFALENDPNDGVRLRALDGLKSYATIPEVRRAFTRALIQDMNAGIRTQAIDVLSSSRIEDGSVDQPLVGACQAVMGRESNSYIRMQCQRNLRLFNASEVMY